MKLITHAKLLAHKYLKDKALQGDFDSAYLLGGIYLYGVKVEKDYAQALQWLQLASDHGVANAKNNLAIMYDEGKGTKLDSEHAMKLWEAAAAAGDDASTYNIGLHYEIGKGAPLSYETAAQYYQKVIDRTENFDQINCAANDLGALYAAGKGVKQDDNEALSLFKQAAMISMRIELPKNTKITGASEKEFQNTYSTYRLAVAKNLPLGTTTLSPVKIAMAKVVADYYQKECRW